MKALAILLFSLILMPTVVFGEFEYIDIDETDIVAREAYYTAMREYYREHPNELKGSVDITNLPQEAQAELNKDVVLAVFLNEQDQLVIGNLPQPTRKALGMDHVEYKDGI